MSANPAELLLCVSQEEAAYLYKFKTTGIQAGSFEEAVYHCYHYWKQSADDFVSEEFIQWVANGLHLSYLALKIKEIAKIQSFGDRLIGFLSLIDYLDPIQITKLKSELMAWEQRLEWERLKEQGDFLLEKGDPVKAYALYKKALALSENLPLLNNAALALTQLEFFEEAAGLLDRAYAMGPENAGIIRNIAEVSIYLHDFERALRALKAAEDKGCALDEIYYLYGELNLQADNIRYSIDYFQKAIQQQPKAAYIFRLADVYLRLRQHDKALDALAQCPVQDVACLEKLAEVHAKSDNLPGAIRAVEKALLQNNASAALWTKLAMYHRLDYDLQRANSAILKALALNPADDRARLENARIKKAMGKTGDYQAALQSILTGFKQNYREISEAGLYYFAVKK